MSNPLYQATQVIALDQSHSITQQTYPNPNLSGATIGWPFGLAQGSPLYYAVTQGTYTRDWQRYFNSSPIAFGTTRINGIDNGPGINQYTMTLLVTTWPTESLPYQQGCTLTWDVQKYNLEASFRKTSGASVTNNAAFSQLQFIDPFGQYPNLDPQTGIYFWKFTETLLPQSTPGLPFIQYEITLTESPPGITIA